MQNRPDLLGLEFLEHRLEGEFPLILVPDYIKSDAPITTLHFHNCSEIGYCQSGSGVMIVGEKVMTYHAGDVTFIAQGDAHFSRSADGTHSQWTWIMFDPLRLLPGVSPGVTDPALYAGRNFKNILPPAEYPGLQPTILRIISETSVRLPHWESAVRALIWDAMVSISRTRSAENSTPGRKPLSRIAPALEALAKDCGEKWTVSELANLCCMSESNFRRVWKDTLGQSPQEYLIMMRMQMAAAILRSSDRPVTEVSLSVGFDSLSSFNRLFRRYFDCTPVQWRKRL